jgi:hypothetical protein
MGMDHALHVRPQTVNQQVHGNLARNVAPSDDGTVQVWLAIAPPDSVNLNVRIQFLVSND